MASSSVANPGKLLIQMSYSSSAVSLAVVGVQLFICIYVLSVFLETSPSVRKGRGAYVAINFVIFALFTVATIIDSHSAFDILFESSPTDVLQVGRKLADTWPNIVSFAANVLVNFVGDGLLVYRCYIIWHDQWWFALLPILSYLSSVAIGITAIIQMRHNFGSGLNITYESLWVFLSVVTNVCVTALISFRLLRARSNISRVLSSKDMAPYTGIISILIESAMPLSVFGVIYAGLTASLQVDGYTLIFGRQVALVIFATLFYAFTALSPQMIIFRVTTGRSWVSSPGTPAHSNPIAFAHSRGEDSMFMRTNDFEEAAVRPDASASSVEEEKRKSTIVVV